MTRDVIRITPDILSIDEAHKLVSDPKAGAIACFTGTTRDNFQGKSVVRLEYEAYRDMACKEMRKVIAQARKLYPDLLHVVMLHRVGVVPVCEASVVVCVSSAHRAPALECCRHLIDALKASVPIWKKEVYGGDSGSEWKANTESVA